MFSIKGVVSDRPSQFDLTGHALYRARWCSDLNISSMGKILGDKVSGVTLIRVLGSPDEMLGGAPGSLHSSAMLWATSAPLHLHTFCMYSAVCTPSGTHTGHHQRSRNNRLLNYHLFVTLSFKFYDKSKII